MQTHNVAQILVELPSASQGAAVLAPRPAEQQDVHPAMTQCLGEFLQWQWFALTLLNFRPEGFHFKIRNWFCFQLGSPDLEDCSGMTVGLISRQLAVSTPTKAKCICYLHENSHYSS